jgi:hypothetical protein
LSIFLLNETTTGGTDPGSPEGETNFTSHPAGFKLVELAPGVTFEEVQQKTGSPVLR